MFKRTGLGLPVHGPSWVGTVFHFFPFSSWKEYSRSVGQDGVAQVKLLLPLLIMCCMVTIHRLAVV